MRPSGWRVMRPVTSACALIVFQLLKLRRGIDVDLTFRYRRPGRWAESNPLRAEIVGDARR